MHRKIIPVENRSLQDLVVVIEPWASEVCFEPGDKCEVIIIGENKMTDYSIEYNGYGLVFFAMDMDSDFQIWQQGHQIG